MDMIGKVRRMHRRDKKSVREIARLTGLSRNTVAKWLEAPLFGWGEAFQFDWSEEGLVVGGIYRRLHPPARPHAAAPRRRAAPASAAHARTSSPARAAARRWPAPTHRPSVPKPDTPPPAPGSAASVLVPSSPPFVRRLNTTKGRSYTITAKDGLTKRLRCRYAAGARCRWPVPAGECR